MIRYLINRHHMRMARRYTFLADTTAPYFIELRVSLRMAAERHALAIR